METKLTFQKYKEIIAEIVQDIARLRQQEKDTRDTYIRDNREFQDGDKVHVWREVSSFDKPTREEYLGIFFIGCVKRIGFRGEMEYEFKKVKKDGTQSEQSAGIYYYSRLQKA